MPALLRTLLAIYLGHLSTDFLLQSHALVADKRAGKFSAYARHGIIHYISTIAFVGFFVRGSFLSLRTHAVLIALTLVHLLIDFAKNHFTAKHRLSNGSRAFVADQILHLLTIACAAKFLTPGAYFTDFIAWIRDFRALPNKFLAVPVVYIAVVFGGGYFIRFLTRSLAKDVISHSPEKPRDQMQNAGLYIGWFERFLVVTAMLLQSPATIGLILTAKAIARYPDFKTERFAEYFLIGTLLSISIAIVGGALLAKIIFGHVKLAG